MTRAILLVTLTCGCNPRSAIPTVSIHALAALHQRDHVTQRKRADDFALQLQLSFATEPHKRAQAAVDDVAAHAMPWDTEPCAEPALCEWARLSEESALLALGVAP